MRDIGDYIIGFSNSITAPRGVGLAGSLFFPPDFNEASA